MTDQPKPTPQPAGEPESRLSSVETELDAMRALASALAPLTPQQRANVMKWAHANFPTTTYRRDGTRTRGTS